MRFLVLGGAGYVGSHFVLHALSEGHSCLVYDNLSRGHRAAVSQQAEWVYGDIQDTAHLSRVLQKFKPDAILHYAAFALVAESVQHPEMYYGNNIEGTRSVIQACLAADQRPALVFSSTCAVFGSPEALPVSEAARLDPDSPYGFTKLACERLLADASRAYGFRVAALRYFNAAGADLEGRIGEKHFPETHLIPILLQSIAQEKELSIFGKDYPTEDGTCVRDYIHVNDLAISHISAAKVLLQNSEGRFEAINLGTGNGYSNLQVIETAGKVVGKKARYVFADRRPGDAVALYADNSKARQLLDFSPRYSDLETILASAWKWMERGEEFALI